MPRTSETRGISWYGTCACKCRLNASVWNDKKDAIIIDADMNAKNWLIKVNVMMNLFGILYANRICECKCNQSCNIGENLDYKNCKRRKCSLIDKLVSEWKDEILNAIPLNTTNTISITDKNNCLICIISLAIVFLLLLVIVCISCYYYYTRYWLKKEYSMSY